MKIKLDQRFKKSVRGVIEKYEFEVGIADGKHYAAKRGARGQKGQDVLTTYAGGPARQIDRSKSDGTNQDVAQSFMTFLGRNFFKEPFEKKTSEIIVFLDEFFKYCFGKSEKKRLTNTLQAVVRNPLLRGDYGRNSAFAKRIKGFDRLGIDTAQMFKSITADVKKLVKA